MPTPVNNHTDSRLTPGEIHDAKNLVVAIRAALAQIAVAETDNPSLSALASIDYASSSLLDVLSTAMVAGAENAVLTECTLGEILGAAVNSMRAVAESKSLHLRCYFDALTFSVMIDRRRVLRGLLNLLDNAIKHSVQGTIVLTACAAAMDGEGNTDTTITISVSDTGPGLSAASLLALNNGLPVEDVSVSSGEGIGLADFQRWLNRVGGTLTVRNRVDSAGSFFQFSLPALVAKPTPPPPTPLIDVVLITEDAEVGRTIAASMPEDWYHGVGDAMVFVTTELYFAKRGRNGAIQVLLIDSETAIGRAVVAGGALQKRRRGSVCIALTRTLPPTAAHWVARGVNASVSLHRVADRLVTTIAQHALFVERAMKPTITGIRKSNALLGRRLLLVDDNTEVLRYCETLARRAGAECVTASDGVETAAIIRSVAPGYFDTILLDYYLPGLRGDQIIQTCWDYFTGVRLILMSANEISDAMLAGMQAKVNLIVKKPFSVPGFYEAIGETGNAGAASSPRNFVPTDTLEALIRGIRSDFIAKLGEWKSRLAESIASGDHESLDWLTHNIKNSAGQCGFSALAERCDVNTRVAPGRATDQEWLAAFCAEADAILLASESVNSGPTGKVARLPHEVK